MIRRTTLQLGLTLGLVALPAIASAQVVRVGALDQQGGGLGSQYTLLTVQSPANTTDESGCIRPDGTTTCLAYADNVVKTGASQSQVQYLNLAGLLGLDGSNLRIVGNFTEQQNASSDVILNDLQVFLYQTTAVDNQGNATAYNTLFASQSLAPRPQTLDDYSGIGGFGYVFGLGGTDVAAFNAALAPYANALNTISVGVAVSLSNVTGGQETFSLARAGGGGTGTVVPEPSTYLLLGSGLLGLASVASRRRRR